MSVTAARQPFVPQSGTVYLVGAGPGDPGLLTLTGADILSAVEVVLHDRLVSPALLEMTREDAEVIPVGKGRGRHTLPQEDINRLLVDRARSGLSVCRLKGGDPFVFGRGAEEAFCLQAHGVPFRVVSGVTSAVAVPAAAGIPVTDRRVTSSFVVLSGHQDPLTPEVRGLWRGAARSGQTLVILMGLARLAAVTKGLVTLGRPAQTPAAAIQQGTTARQRVVTAPLGELAERVLNAHLAPPVTLVVGDVVDLRVAPLD